VPARLKGRLVADQKDMLSKTLKSFGDVHPKIWQLVGMMLLLIFGIFVVAAAVISYKPKMDADAVFRSTPAGKIAVQMYDECIASRGIFGGNPTSALCVIQTVDAARTMGGQQFSAEVSSVLKSKLMMSGSRGLE